jgi:hypothetical protein
MNSRWGAIVLTVALSGAGQAHAGLVGNSINSLNYYMPSIASGIATPQIELTSQTSNYPFSIGASGLYFLTGGADSPIHVGDTQIVIGRNLAAPYCTTSPCVDGFDGFVFVFSSGVNITNVSIDGVTPSNSPWRNAAINLVSGMVPLCRSQPRSRCLVPVSSDWRSCGGGEAEQVARSSGTGTEHVSPRCCA